MSSSLLPLLSRLGHPAVLVLGDLMLDRYVWGDVVRISPEAPVPVLRATRQEERLGGAASVAALLASLGAKVRLAGVVGADSAGVSCRQLLNSVKIDATMVLRDPSRQTTRKERYLGSSQQKYPQQVLRVDHEHCQPLDERLIEEMRAGLVSCLDSTAIVLISDYGKGACVPGLLAPLISAACRRGQRVIVDPAPAVDWSCYQGCQLLVPNRAEASRFVARQLNSVDAAFGAAAELRDRLGLEAGLIKLDHDGVVTVDGAGGRQHYPALERQVYDITGAGDTLLAVLGLALGDNYSLAEAIQLAVVAAGLQVERVGVTPISRAELCSDICRRSAVNMEKLVPVEAVLAELNMARRCRKRIAFTNGCFDLLHPGHIHLLGEARRQADLLVVGLNDDSSVRRLKGSDRPIQNEGSRAQVLAALGCVDYICLFSEDTPENLIRAIQPDVLVKGADYRPEQIAGWTFVEARGGRLHLVPLLEGQSTSALAKRMQQSAAP